MCVPHSPICAVARRTGMYSQECTLVFVFFMCISLSALVYVFSVSSGIQNITELSDWRKEYTTVVKWIDMNEKKLAAQGEPGGQHKDLSNKCTTLDVSIYL